jgi:2-polyprenyl-6-methoxyphenol hydroxylase-like FAD-dependent oxidoreductase
MDSFDVAVHGSGIVGRSLALALGSLGLRVAIVGEPGSRRSTDVRAYALNAASVALLRRLKVWEALPPHTATPVYDMEVHGDAPQAHLEFSAWQQRASELAWIVDAALLEHQLDAAIRFAPHVQVFETAPPATLAAVCEGRNSAMRETLGIEFERHDYGQRAVAARLVASVPHQGVARQWFRAPDVLALLPFDAPQPGASYGLVWSVPAERADELLAMDAASFDALLSEATGAAAGELHLASERAAWPLALATASRWAGPGWVLLGDAAHLVHPLAGQGLNLGLADVAALTATIGAREPWRRLDDPRLLRRYVRERAVPTWAMGRTTDALLRLFAHPAAPVRELRNRGLTLVDNLPPLKRWLTQRALGS